MSASAPLGSPSTNIGSVLAVDTSATITGLGVSEVISQAAAMSFIPIVTLAASQASHRPRKTGPSSGSSAAGSLIGRIVGPALPRARRGAAGLRVGVGRPCAGTGPIPFVTNDAAAGRACDGARRPASRGRRSGR